MAATADQAVAAGSLRAAMRHRGFPRFIVATTVSSAGDFLSSVGLLVVIYRVTGSASWLGGAVFFRVAAWALATAAGGVVGDRYDRRKILVVLNVVAGVIALTLAGATEARAAIVVLVFVAGSLDFVTGLSNPSFAAAVPSIVGEDDVAAANAAVTTVEQVSQIAGPALGALIVALSSPQLAFLVNGLTFLVAAVLVAGVPAGGNIVADDDEPPARFRDGLLALRASRSAAVLLGVFVAAVFSYGFGLVLFVLVAVQRLGMAEASVGYLRMAEGVGGVASAVVAGRFAAKASARTLMIAGVLTGLPVVLLAFTTSRIVSFAVLALGGGAYVVLEVIVITWVQRVTPVAMLGRIMGLLMSMGAIGTALGAALASTIDGAFGLRWALGIGGGVLIVAMVAAAPALPGVARLATRRGQELEPFVAVLRRLDLFSAADESTLERLAGSIVVQEVGASAVVIRQGDEADDLYVVRAGALEVTATAGAALPQTIDHLGVDDWFGEVGLIRHVPRTATVTATEPTTLWRIRGDVFVAAFEQLPARPDIGWSGIAARSARAAAVSGPDRR